MSGPAKRHVALPRLLPRLVPVLLVVLVTGVVLLVATLAASTGPTKVFAGSGPDPARISTNLPSETATPPASEDPESDVERLQDVRARESLTRLGAVVRALLLALVVGTLVVALVVRARRGRRRRAASAIEEATDTDFGIVGAYAAVSSALVGDAERQDEVLREGTPRNGIVAAWLRFEQRAAGAGAPREEWETSSEFTLRLLASVRADPDATARLAGLYRVARFSDHPMSEDDRESAAAALGRIRDALRSPGREPR